MPPASKVRTTDGRGRLFDSVLDTVGDTPCIRVNNLAPKGVRIYVKAEAFNPAASVKDRLALNIIEAAERNGTLKPGQTVVEATSGNTGIGLAMVCAQKGYPLVVTMADSFSIERRRLMRLLGAKVVLTPRAAKGFGMYQKAVELAQANGWFLAHQFETEANAEIHEATTAREILGDFKGERLDYFVTGYGTGGTVVGRRARPPPRTAEDEDHPERARERAARRQRHGPETRPPTARRPPATRRSSRIRSRAGRPISFRSCCRRRSTRSTTTRSFRSRAPKASSGRGRSPRRKASSAASPSGATFAVGDADRREGGIRQRHPVHAARHGRALPHHAAVRGHRRRT